MGHCIVRYPYEARPGCEKIFPVLDEPREVYHEWFIKNHKFRKKCIGCKWKEGIINGPNLENGDCPAKDGKKRQD